MALNGLSDHSEERFLWRFSYSFSGPIVGAGSAQIMSSAVVCIFMIKKKKCQIFQKV